MQVVKVVLDRLGRPALDVVEWPVDLEDRVADIRLRLKAQAGRGAAVLGLHGMGGIGKTVLAKAVFNALRMDFPASSCFLEVGQHVRGLALQQLQRRVLKDLSNCSADFNTVDQGRAALVDRLHSSTVLLVIDDIWAAAQRDALLVPLGPGSCVVLTTRNAQLLSCAGIPSQPVELLNSQAAMRVFCGYAFVASEPPSAYSELAAEAVTVCAGLPLTLKVIGAHLRDEQNRESWQAALTRLRAAEPLAGGRTEDDEVWGVLKVSFDALGGPEQQMFLDIACCMLGKSMTRVLPAWGPGARSTLRNLTNKAMASVHSGGRLTMHDQLRDMARTIVGTENIDKALRSRLWVPDSLQLASGKKVS